MSRAQLTPEDVGRRLADEAYLADRGLATVLAIALRLGRPLLLEGDAGVGKTEVAKALARALGARLIRLQCYEGIDVSHALYDWNYARQMLYIRTLEASDAGAPDALVDVFSEPFLVRRPLLDALEPAGDDATVLLIDEVDRADDEFEAFLLELLSDFQVTIPELGTIRATSPPIVILTSNRTRELHDALKRRCLYHWVGHPTMEREVAIVRLRVPDAADRLVREVAGAVGRLRELDLVKPPGVAETIDWTEALSALGADRLDPALADDTLGAVLKQHEDLVHARRLGAERLLEGRGGANGDAADRA